MPGCQLFSDTTHLLLVVSTVSVLGLQLIITVLQGSLCCLRHPLRFQCSHLHFIQGLVCVLRSMPQQISAARTA